MRAFCPMYPLGAGGCRSARGVSYSGAAPPGANPDRPMTDGAPLTPAPQIGRFAGHCQHTNDGGVYPVGENRGNPIIGRSTVRAIPHVLRQRGGRWRGGASLGGNRGCHVVISELGRMPSVLRLTGLALPIHSYSRGASAGACAGGLCGHGFCGTRLTDTVNKAADAQFRYAVLYRRGC